MSTLALRFIKFSVFLLGYATLSEQDSHTLNRV